MGSLSFKGPGLYSYKSSKAELNQVMQVLSQDFKLTMVESGRFWQWNGEEHPW